MSSQEIISLIFALGFLIIAVCAVFITFYLIKALKSITSLADSLQNTTKNFREKIQNRFLLAVPSIFVAIVSRLVGGIFKKREVS